MDMRPVSASADASENGAYAAGLHGEVYAGRNFRDLDDALASSNRTPDAIFVSDGLDYALNNGTLAAFLGADAGTLSNAVGDSIRDQFALRLSGQIYLEAGTHRFNNVTDDGFRLTIDGQQIAEYTGHRAADGTRGVIEIAEAGWYSIDIDYFEGWAGAQLQIWHRPEGGSASLLDASRLRHAIEDTDGGTPVEPEPAENTAPTANADIRRIDEDGRLLLNPLENDTDADGDRLFITRVGDAANGTVTLNADGTITYVPNADFNGRDKFVYQVSDGRGGVASARVIVDVNAVNDAPIARRDAGYSVNTGQVLNIAIADLLANDRDPEGDTLSILRLGDPTNGTVRIVGDQIRFTASGEGEGGFSYVVSDGRGGEDSATVSVAITGTDPEEPIPAENARPDARDDSRRMSEDGSLRVAALDNDVDADGDALSITAVGEAGRGTATLNADGTISYVPNANFSGTDSFTYTISDGNGGTDTARVNVTVDAVNDAPVASNDGGYSVETGHVLTIDIADLLANDRDVDGDALTVLRLSNAANGSAEIVGNQIRFTASGEGDGGFSYVVSDGRGGEDSARVSVNVAATDTDGGDGGTGNGGDGGHGSGGGLIDPPVTPQEIAEFVDMVRNMPEHQMEGGGAGAQMHMAALDLVPRGDATHIAINHGDWNDPSTWHNGQVPGEGARVLIPEGISVGYSAENDASIFTVRVDGNLHFTTNQDSRLLVDTMVVSPTGHLEIGTADNPVRANVNVDIVFADNGNIDTGWDPALLSRGLVAMGEVDIAGTEKTSHVKVQVDAMAGDTSLTLAEVPTGWQVGDKLVLTGTYQQGFYYSNELRRQTFAESQDEEVYISSINGNTITLDRPLTYDHDTPRDDLKAYVANMSRNVTFSSEGGEDLPNHQRGHVMFMHNDDVDARYAGFVDLGRTDKSEYAGPAEDFGGVGNLAADANVEARYPFHFHEAGVDDIENPAIAIGNVVDGSPGWGFVQHSSNANLTNNVAFDVFGAAFVAEDGNETGTWLRNIAIKAQGVGFGDGAVKNSELDGNDARTGDGFWFSGRLVEAAENVAANTTHGFVWLTRGDRDAISTDTLHQSEIGFGRETMASDLAPIQGFRDNEAFGTNTGLIVVKDTPNNGHDVRSVMDGFLNWETREGVNISYSSSYTLLDFDLLGQRGEDSPGPGWNAAYQGVKLGTNAVDIVFNGLEVEGFDYGLNLIDNNNINTGRPGAFYNTVIDAVLNNNSRADVAEGGSSQLQRLTSGDLNEGRLEFLLTADRFISASDNMFLDGTKTDSIGSVDRSFELTQLGLWNWQKDIYLQTKGYWRTADGTPVALVEDYLTDRATGEMSKSMLVYELDYSSASLRGLPYNGVINLGGPAAIARNDSASTAANTSLRLDLTANDSDPDGGAVNVDGLTNPVHGNVFLQNDGTVLYTPDQDFVGVDRFYYWAADEEGNFTRAEAVVTVGNATAMSEILQTAIGSDMFDY